MTQPSRTTVASITFEGDHRLTALQALSVDRLFELDELEEYLIVLNGRDNSDLRVTLAGLLYGAVSAELWDRIRFLVPADVPRGGDGQGWHGQQALKLGLADLVRTDTYLMLDGKNHFVRPAGVADFYETGRPKTVWSDTSPYWDKYVRASLDAFDVLTDENARRMMPTTTPYLFISEEVRRTIDGLESKYGIPLKSAMGKTKWGTEFFLYWPFTDEHG
ncbi:hypothetical protein E4A47_05800 [Micrococcus flavus]|uniref:Uncharacterized protein n=1 Tax=Micrococcus flavus TaxID=384602 RepID=A0A4Y8X1U5_9MICC|nr:DUF6492 family protein [Micrococcus flavus]MBB4882072.1 hypothetical protein [Micrococcus flavus]TFI02823.1 hypothetical protein E4A47_05800 [Micrococcus flavus]GGK47207.1 hypothetical protein GCM10007073_12900 [Micrococcus flavus]